MCLAAMLAGSCGDGTSAVDGSVDASGEWDFGGSTDAAGVDGPESPTDAGGDFAARRPCSFHGATIPHGGRVIAYGAPRVATGASCEGVAEERVCEDSVLSGASRFAHCVADRPAFETRRRWYYEWNGSGNPNDDRRPYRRWLDQPHGDDYDDFTDPVNNCRAHFDTPPGHFSIDLIKTPSGGTCPLTRRGESTRRFTGLIAMRDPVLENSSGLTFEFRIRIPDHNRTIQSDAVLFQVFNPHGNIGLAFSPECVKAGAATAFPAGAPPDCTDGAVTRAREVEQTSSNTYRVVAAPRSTRFDLYRNGNPLFTGVQGGRAPGSPFEAPVPPGEFAGPNNRDRDGAHFQLGDTAAQDTVVIGEDTSGAFVLDSLRYRPGQYPPGTEPPVTVFAEPTAPRSPAADPSEYHGLIFDPALTEGVVDESSRVARIPGFDGLPSSGYLETVRGMRIDATRSTRILELLTPTSIVGNDGWELVIDVATRAPHEELAFYMGVTDRTGSVDLMLSPDRVELRIGRTFHSYSAPVFIDTSVRHVYRLYKPAGGTDVHLYIDDGTEPVVAQFTTGMSQLNPGHTPAEGEDLQMQVILGAALVLPRRHDAVFGASSRGEYDVDLHSIHWRRVSSD